MSNYVNYSDYLKYISDNGYGSKSIIYLLENLLELNNIKELTSYKIDNYTGNTAQFVPKYNSIYINSSKIPVWLKNNIDDDNLFPEIKDRKLLKDYMVLNIMIHEVEHAKQFLMGKELIDSKSKYVTYAYNKLTNLLIKPNYILPRPIKEISRYIKLVNYLKNKENYLLERNANVEAYNIVGILANFNKDYDIANTFISIALEYMKLGYKKDNVGCLIHTLDELGYIIPDYNENSNIDFQSKIHLGLPITTEERNRLLNLK